LLHALFWHCFGTTVAPIFANTAKAKSRGCCSKVIRPYETRHLKRLQIAVNVKCGNVEDYVKLRFYLMTVRDDYDVQRLK
jgi:hypothetical protein